MITIDLDDTRIPESMQPWHIEGLRRAAETWERVDLNPAKCPVIIKGGRGYYVRYIGKQCVKKAGQGSFAHEGFGRCIAHGGAKREGRAEGAWLMSFKFAQEYDVSPWEALLYVIRITAGRVRYCEFVLAQATTDAEIEGRVSEGEMTGVSESGEVTEARNMSWWVETSERERMMLAKVSKAAIDAGVAQILVEQELAQGNRLADGLLGVYESLRDSGGLSGEQLETVLEAMKAQLARMDALAGGGVSGGGAQQPSLGSANG